LEIGYRTITGQDPRRGRNSTEPTMEVRAILGASLDRSSLQHDIWPTPVRAAIRKCQAL